MQVPIIDYSVMANLAYPHFRDILSFPFLLFSSLVFSSLQGAIGGYARRGESINRLWPNTYLLYGTYVAGTL